MLNNFNVNKIFISKLSKFEPRAQGLGPLGGGRRAGGGPDNGRAAEWAHGGPWAGPMGQGPWARAMGPGPKPIYHPC